MAMKVAKSRIISRMMPLRSSLEGASQSVQYHRRSDAFLHYAAATAVVPERTPASAACRRHRDSAWARPAGSGVVRQPLDPGVARAAGAAEHLAAGLQAVPDDAAATVGALRRQPMDGALEAVEHVSLPGLHHLERALVVV